MRFAFITLLIALLTAAVFAIVIVPPEDLRRFQGKVAANVKMIWERIEDRTGETQDRASEPQDRPQAAKSERMPRERPSSDPADGQPIGAWNYRCDLDQPASARQCGISHTITDGPNGPVAFQWTINSDPEGNLSSIWQTQTGVKVNRGIVLEAGTPQPVVIPYEDCTTQFCISRANLATDFINTLSQVTAASATITTISGAPITFEIDVDGLADGLRLLQ